MLKSLPSFFLLFLSGFYLPLSGSPEIEYRRPSEKIAGIIEKPWLPAYSPDPTGQRLLRLEMSAMLPLEHLAREEIRLVELSMFAETRCRSRTVYANGGALIDCDSGSQHTIVGLPWEPVIVSVHWASNGKYLALLLEAEKQVELWRVNAETARAVKWSDLPVHAGMEQMLDWSSDNQSIWLKTVPASLGPPPKEQTAPSGIVVRQTDSGQQPVQTYQGLLKTQLDVDIFEYYFTSQITRVFLDGSHEFVGLPGVYRSFKDSPDQNYLLIESFARPYSYLVTEELFAVDLEVWDLSNSRVIPITSAPAAENLPYGKGHVRQGARDYEWRSDLPATVIWVEAQDGGNPYSSAKIRDIVFSVEAPFTEHPGKVVELRDRLGDFLFLGNQKALLVSWDWTGREVHLSSLDYLNKKKPLRRLLSFTMGDRYRHPGLPLVALNEKGFSVVQTDTTGEHIYLFGEGGSLEGDRPFVDRLNLKSKRKKRIFRSRNPNYEIPIALLDAEKEEFLIQRESNSIPPSYFKWNPKDKFHTQLTSSENPYSEMQGVQRKLLRYKRSDGVRLTANLFLPAGYNPKKDGPLPTLVWAYPRAYQNAENASQLKKSPHQFVHPRWHRPSFWVLDGYAVLDDPAMPIVASDQSNANDSFIPQLVDSARAAVRELIRQGVSERGKIAVGGHSYGAFMTANLLAHTDLFCAGIARSGAYNRTLTPFGFQSEERNLWQAPRVYLEMSPLLNAARIDEPLLLIHGMEDQNAGTYPLQSERLFHALNGLGGQARLVLLPEEGHSIRSKESIMHLLWEMEQWLGAHVKGEIPSTRQPMVIQSKSNRSRSPATEGTGEKED